MTRRDEQRAATHRRILEAAVQTLVAGGYAACTTVAVQRRAAVSRGALLHHFPTRAALFSAAIGQLMVSNESAVRDALADLPQDADPVERALRTLYRAYVRPAFGAELELWAAARTDKELRAALRRAEHDARPDLYRVVDEVFGPELTGAPDYRVVAALTVEFLRGLAITGPLRAGGRGAENLLDEWVRVVRQLFDQPADGTGRAPDGAARPAPPAIADEHARERT